MASGWLKRRTNGRDETLYVYRDATGAERSRTIGTVALSAFGRTATVSLDAPTSLCIVS